MFSIFKGLGTTLSNSFLITVYSKGNWYTRMSSSMDFSIFSPISFHLNLLKLKHVCLHPCIFATNNNSWKPLNFFQSTSPSNVFCCVSCHECFTATNGSGKTRKAPQSSLKSPILTGPSLMSTIYVT